MRFERVCILEIQDESGIHGGVFFRFGSFWILSLETVMRTDHAHGSRAMEAKNLTLHPIRSGVASD